ncbi:MAG: hypothetical protein ACJAVR_001361 [Paracoccaceae bacterium]|jgi:hypothetical protein
MVAEKRTEAAKAEIRLASKVIVVAMLAWVGLSLLGGQMGWPIRFAFLIDMLCLAALGWALWTIIRVWRARAGKGS